MGSLSKKLNDVFNSQCLLLTVKHAGSSVMAGAAIYWGSLRLMIALHDCITAYEYEAILQNQVHPVVQILFLHDIPIYQDDNATIHTAK